MRMPIASGTPPEPVGEARIVKDGLEAQAGLFEHAARGAIGRGREADDFAELELARMRESGRRDLGPVADAPELGAHRIQQLDGVATEHGGAAQATTSHEQAGGRLEEDPGTEPLALPVLNVSREYLRSTALGARARSRARPEHAGD